MDNIFNTVSSFTLLSKERIYNNINSVQEILDKDIPGDIIEIGVYKGGSIMSMIMTLNNNHKLRHVRLYDTFQGMTNATEHDVITHTGIHYDTEVKYNSWYACISHLPDVQNNVKTIPFPEEYIHYHVGDIMKTTEFPESIALLRLDTDFYDSTKFELEHFYPLVSKGGIIIIDDYGHWSGSKKATDEFLMDKPEIKLINIDYTGVYFYKP